MRVTLSLQDRKSARIRLRVLDTVLELMHSGPFHTISAEQICAGAEISRATFFNYFVRKEGVMFYFALVLWLEFTVERLRTPLQGLRAVYRIFDRVAERYEKQPGSILGFIEFCCRMDGEQPWREQIKLTPADKKLLHPDVEGIEDVEIMPLRIMLQEHLEEAIKHGELDPGLTAEDGAQILGTVLYGAPLMALLMRRAPLEQVYRNHLDRLFKK